MSASPLRPSPDVSSYGGPLTREDYDNLATSWITPEIADAAGLRRVSAQEGREIVGQKGRRDCAGILFSYFWPGESWVCTHRVRLDNPEVRVGADGTKKLQGKYLGAPGAGNRLYIPRGVTPEQLADVGIPIVIVEGEKKALALWRLANHDKDEPRFIPIAIAGVWSWRGKIGRTRGPNGESIDVKGPIADLSRIDWGERKVFLLFDANVHTNDSVKWARKGIWKELAGRRAKVNFVTLPEDCGVNGVDDLLPIWGPDKVLALFENAASATSLTVSFRESRVAAPRSRCF